jgi:hypothetical protein
MARALAVNSALLLWLMLLAGCFKSSDATSDLADEDEPGIDSAEYENHIDLMEIPEEMTIDLFDAEEEESGGEDWDPLPRGCTTDSIVQKLEVKSILRPDEKGHAQVTASNLKGSETVGRFSYLAYNKMQV